MRMRILLPLFSIAAGAAIGLSAGVAWRHIRANGPEQAFATAGSEPGNSGHLRTGKRNSRNVSVADDSPLATQLAYSLSKSSGVTRWLYWWDALEKAGPADFVRLARLAGGDRAATRLVAERWAELAPKQFFETLRSSAKAGRKMSDDLADTLFTDWLKHDQAAALAALNEKEDFPGRTEYRRQVASSLMGTDPEAALRAMSQWHIETYSPDLGALRSWAAADPRHAAEFTIANPAGYVSREVMNIIGETWAKSDPGQAMAFAVTQPGDLARALGQTILKNWAQQDLTQAANWLANADPSTLNKFSATFVEAWARQDAPSALAWCQSNLAGSTLLESVRSLFNGAAQTDLNAAASLVSSMPSGPIRSQAAAAVADKWFPQGFGNKPVPDETLAWLSGLDPDSVRQVVDTVSWRWTDTDPGSMAAFLQSASNIAFPTFTYQNLANTLARDDPAAALDWASHLPQGLGIGAGSSAFGQWGRAQTDVAMQWLNQLPATDPRRQPFFNSLVQQLAWDPQALDQFAQVAGQNPAAARSVLQSMSLPDDRRSALLARLSAQAGP